MSGEVTRPRLHALLAEACELEHALCCSYLFAAFSLRRDIADGLDWRRQQIARKWASQIYHVAAQEMLHLAQAWNLLTATGGAPYYGRPDFPQPARNFPLNVALALRRFDRSTLERFLIYENPGDFVIEESVREQQGLLWPLDESYDYQHVGELYGEIARIIAEHDHASLFVDDPDGQRSQTLVDFYDIVAVTDAASAAQAIETIVEQGEGSPGARSDSHFGVFLQIRNEMREEAFDYAHPVADNPYLGDAPPVPIVTADDRFKGAGIVTVKITDTAAVHAIDLFNDAYVAMLQALAHLFAARNQPRPHLERVSRAAIELMITVIKPLGEAICRMPSGQPRLNAGPSFELPRHVALPQTEAAASEVLGDRLLQLAQHGRLLADSGGVAPVPKSQIAGAVTNLERLAREFRAGIAPRASRHVGEDD